MVATITQVIIDVHNHDYYAAGLDALGLVLGIWAAGSALRALQATWALKDELGPAVSALRSGNWMALVALLARAAGLRSLKEAMDSKSIRYATVSIMAGVWANVGNGGECP